MDNKCFCHLNGYEVKDANARKNIDTINTEVSILKTRVNTALSLPDGSTSGDGELIDIRVGVNGQVYNNAGESVREQVSNLAQTIIDRTNQNEYTNILKDIPEDNITDFPVIFPYKKMGLFLADWDSGLKVNANSNCYIIEVTQGERFNISNFVHGGTPTYILDSDLTIIKTIGSSASNNLFGGVEAIPENASYLVLHTTGDSDTPCVTRVSEPIITTDDTTVSNASKFISQQKRSTTHLCYDGGVGETLKSVYMSDTFNGIYKFMFASGVYHLVPGKEYVICYNDSEIPQYAFCGYICSEDFTITNRIEKEDLDGCMRYVFTATENDKYLALNCFDFNGNLQVGESRAKHISKVVKIGDAIFDYKNDISLSDIGGISYSLSNKCWVSYGDSITWGTGVNTANGEKRWQDYLTKRYNIINHINLGIGSTSIGFKDGMSFTNTPPMSDDDRLNNLISKSPDIVTILGGANDLSYDIPLGNNDDITNKNRMTFKGAYAYIIDKILTAKPDTVIVLMGMYLAMNFTGVRTYTLQEYAAATKEIATYFGLPFVDLNECGFNTYNFNTTNAVFSADRVHPNAEGVKRIAMVVSKCFDSFTATND